MKRLVLFLLLLITLQCSLLTVVCQERVLIAPATLTKNLQTDYHASGAGETTTTTSGSTGPGTSVVVASAATWKVNHGIWIDNAGVAGADYVGTVTAISGTTFTVSPATSATVPNRTLVRHEDSLAIRSALEAANTAKGIHLVAPAGRYKINIPSTTVSGQTAKIFWPRRNAADGGITIMIEGEAPPAHSDSTIGSLAIPTGGTIFETDDTTSTGALFGGNGPAYDNQTAVKMVFKNVLIRVNNPDPTMTALDLHKCYTAIVDNVRVDSGTETINIKKAPSNAGAFGIRMPNAGNGVESKMQGVVSVSGFYYGVEFGEHDDVDFLIVFASNYVAKLGFAYFPTHIKHLVSANNNNGLHVTDHHRLILDHWGVEHYHTSSGKMPPWMETELDIQDDLNRLTGSVKLSVLSVQAGNKMEFAFTGLRSLRHISYVDESIISGRIFTTAPTSATSVPTGGNATTFSYPSETHDPYDMHSTTVNTSRVTIPFPGEYTFHVSVEWAANATGSRRIHMKKNGGFVDYADATATPTGTFRQTATFPNLFFQTGDFIEFAGQQDSGSAVDVTRVVVTYTKIQ